MRADDSYEMSVGAPFGRIIRGSPYLSPADRQGSSVTFVGRERERALLRNALDAGQGVVLRGRYGLGRTALVRAVADELGPAWRFVIVDFREPPARVCAQFAAMLLVPPRRRSQTPATYRGMRCWLAKGRRVPGTPVLVLDDIGRLTPAKWRLLRFLSSLPRLRIVAIVEPFFPAREIMRLRVALYPSVELELHRLPLEASMRFFADASARYGLGWSDERVRLLATSRGGYPLEMTETVARARKELAARLPLLGASR